jgi:MFS family permease
MPIYAIFVQKIGGDILDASGAIAVFFISQGLFTILIHRLKWSDDYRSFLLVFGWVIWLSGIVAYLFVSNMIILLLAQVLTALGNAIADPVFYNELSENIDRHKKEFEWGFFEGMNVILDGIAALIGGLIVNYYGFRPLIYVMIMSATTSLLLILVYLHKKKHLSLLEKMVNVVK